MDQEHRETGGQEQGRVGQEMPELPGQGKQVVQSHQFVAGFHQLPAQPHPVGKQMVVQQIDQEAAGQQLGVLDHVPDPEDEEHDADDEENQGRRRKEPGQEQDGPGEDQHGPEHGGGFHQKEQHPARNGGGIVAPARPAQGVIPQSPQGQQAPPVPGVPHLGPYPFLPCHPTSSLQKVCPHGSTGEGRKTR